MVHLYTLGFRGEDLISFDLSLNNPSRLAELQQLEYMRTKFDVANAVPEGTYSKHWIANKILGLSDEEFLRNQRESFYDRKFQQSLESAVDQGTEDLLSGGDLAGGDLGDLGDLGSEELGSDDEPGEELGGEEGAPEEAGETALLDAPGRREDRRRTSGPARRRRKKEYIPMELSTPRRVSGASQGTVRPVDLRALVTQESKEANNPSTYNNSEVRLMENTARVRKLVEELENKEAKKNEA